ncbi:transport and Golgi organization protein 1 homolog isoform X2 [Choloepus didactylus]|uniref:transport and Golgi organization protein 1 homolog isoform X1 n=1 Tax=Choloepus didactylus TaxID=27675 RepID=UPI00189FDED8|nr:transport and Golgi organization protein 1 homolog isoform X1 [Choloepus didactylus]XP_037702267.1 transport and Golgi organization protein 1 homolog isoform X1 [Choloepus didactylus]XP_037702268.1 transport and Golgi organization protein 1 homolog isoform X1 [Choloepus didactylus]XP_037702270.1 transport and Golgi organization protein 1 homolog isoform X2 [Choloepus didactylus]
MFRSFHMDLIQSDYVFTSETQDFLTNLAGTLLENFPYGPDFQGASWTPVNIAAFFINISLIIFFWMYVLDVRHRLHGKFLQEESIAATLKHYTEDNQIFFKKLHDFEVKLGCIKNVFEEINKTNKIVCEEVKKIKAVLPSHCGLGDSLPRSCSPEESKKYQGDEDSLQSTKEALESEMKQLQMKREMLQEAYEQRKTAIQENVERKMQEHLESERQLLAIQKKLKSATEEAQKYKGRMGELEEDLRQSERTFIRQVASACQSGRPPHHLMQVITMGLRIPKHMLFDVFYFQSILHEKQAHDYWVNMAHSSPRITPHGPPHERPLLTNAKIWAASSNLVAPRASAATSTSTSIWMCNSTSTSNWAATSNLNSTWTSTFN